MKITDAERLIEEFRVPAHIRKHCQKVVKIALEIGQAYKDKGFNVDLDILYQAALLHDLFRVVDIPEQSFIELCEKSAESDVKIWKNLRVKYAPEVHSEAVFEYLTEIGEPVLAKIIKRHKFSAIIDPEEMPETLEEKIVTYADKRVLHDKIVSLAERFEDGLNRYNPLNENMDLEKKIQNAYFVLEKELFQNIAFKPKDFTEQNLDNHGF